MEITSTPSGAASLLLAFIIYDNICSPPSSSSPPQNWPTHEHLRYQSLVLAIIPFLLYHVFPTLLSLFLKFLVFCLMRLAQARQHNFETLTLCEQERQTKNNNLNIPVLVRLPDLRVAIRPCAVCFPSSDVAIESHYQREKLHFFLSIQFFISLCMCVHHVFP